MGNCGGCGGGAYQAAHDMVGITSGDLDVEPDEVEAKDADAVLTVPGENGLVEHFYASWRDGRIAWQRRASEGIEGARLRKL